MKIDWLKIKQIGITVAAVLGLLLGLVNYFNGALPLPVPVKIESLGGSNFTQIDVADGTAAEPSLGFTSDLDNGLYRIGANNIGIAAGGSKIIDIGANGATIDNLNATTITATTIISQAIDFSGVSATLTGDAQARNITATATISSAGAANFGSLQIGSVSFTGPMKYGTIANQADGASIAHGFVTTPTVCLVSGTSGITATIGTITTTGFSVNVPSTIAVYWMCGQ